MKDIDISKMTLKEKIGQLVWVGFHGYEFNDNLKYLIDNYKVGNIILFTRNIKDCKQLFELNKKIHDYVLKTSNIMPFISIDQEGGMVTRIMNGATFCPGNMTLATTDPSNSYVIGKLMGEELRSLGINYNLAPSLDVNNNPNNSVIGVRSYSDTPSVVTKYGINYIKGLQETGVIATAKHFPGHGDTNVDSHKALPTIAKSIEEIERIELVPFKNVINDVKAIMTAHVFFPAYEENNVPATLSKNVITGLLRNRLGYQGIITSDCMEMKAIDDNFTTPIGCFMGLKAGLDQVMVSQSFEKQVKTFDLLLSKVENNELSILEVDEKVKRILKAKAESYALMKKYFYGKEFDDVKNEVINEEHKKIAAKIVDDSLTLVRGKNITLDKKTLVIATEPFATTNAEDELSNRSIYWAIKENNLKCDVEKINITITEEEIDKLVNKCKKYEQVLVCTYNANIFTVQSELVNKIHFNCENELFVLSTRSPYDINRFQDIENYLCLYEYTPNSVNTIIKYLKQEIVPFAKCPVTLKKKIKVGASVYVGLADYKLEDNLNYLDTLKRSNIEYVFISAHMPEANSDFIYELNEVCNKAFDLGIKVCLDISKPMMDKIELPKIYSLRLDYGFSLEDIKRMYFEKKFVIELNASTISLESLRRLQEMGVNLKKVRISHNFYPKLYTGLRVNDVIEKNIKLHELGMSVMIYIPSSNQKRMPMYEGLPTVELHRNLNLYSILSTIKYLQCDEVFFGDSFASVEELNLASNFDYDETIIPILIRSNLSIDELELLRSNHVARRDENDYFVRSSTRSKNPIEAINTVDRKKYDVTIDNSKFNRYCGEVGIMRCDLEKDERCNVCGVCLINDLVLDSLGPNKKFKFIIVGEIKE